MSEKKIYVIYHMDCADGYGAAWAAWKLFGDEAEYIATPAGGDRPEAAVIPDGSVVYILDVYWPPEVVEAHSGRLEAITCVDHHQVPAEWLEYEYPDNVTVFHDRSRSAAVLAWTFFHREKKIPEILLYIEDRDLWKWELKDSEAILAGLDAYPYTWSNMERLQDSMAQLKDQGNAIIRWRNQLLDLQLKNAHKVRVTVNDEVGIPETSYVVPAVNCSIRALASESGHELLRRNPEAPFVFIYRRNSEGGWDVSLRSSGSFNVALLAQKFGGGGHPEAAGMTLDKLPPVVTGD